MEGTEGTIVAKVRDCPPKEVVVMHWTSWVVVQMFRVWMTVPGESSQSVYTVDRGIGRILTISSSNSILVGVGSGGGGLSS
jgi:hypothetical protein